ncbi:uncharacterized protein L201_007490 [Kwoniella dendrophila CBS 6074]|uniref:Uncharacterized protein n=1 Tax=Kwoniella dendrophila CBS 6074 TaxID=1295534 RepID=A0AAX4K480_9TREE
MVEHHLFETGADSGPGIRRGTTYEYSSCGDPNHLQDNQLKLTRVKQFEDETSNMSGKPEFYRIDVLDHKAGFFSAERQGGLPYPIARFMYSTNWTAKDPFAGEELEAKSSILTEEPTKFIKNQEEKVQRLYETLVKLKTIHLSQDEDTNSVLSMNSRKGKFERTAMHQVSHMGLRSIFLELKEELPKGEEGRYLRSHTFKSETDNAKIYLFEACNTQEELSDDGMICKPNREKDCRITATSPYLSMEAERDLLGYGSDDELKHIQASSKSWDIIKDRILRKQWLTNDERALYDELSSKISST